MKLTGIELSKGDKGQNLLMVTFEDDGEEKEWMPIWDDLRHALRAAIITEVVNRRGAWNMEMERFWETAKFLRWVCYIVAAMNEVNLP